MNLLLLSTAEWLSNSEPFEITLTDRRAQHIHQILRASAGDKVKTGLLNGNIGYANVRNCSASEVRLAVDPMQFNQPPPSPSPVKFIIALPRPKVARRIVRAAVECGVKTLHFIHSYKVEKSYWHSPLLTEKKLNEQVLQGLEQSIDTQSPDITFHQRFKPFVEDTLPGLIANTPAFLGDPKAERDIDQQLYQNKAMWLVIGPEGGFIPYEIDQFLSAGCVPFNLGPRIYRVETVIPWLMGLAHSAHLTPVPPSPQ